MKKAFSLTRHCSANPSCHCEGGTTEAIQKKVRRSTGLPHSRWSLAMTSFKPAFSLVEMLMALLVASLLLAALAPVMTKRMNDSMTISIEGEIPGKITKIHEIEYDSVDCPGGTKAKIDEDGSQYCEGEFTVPQGYNGQMKVTVIGAGGGGGVAPTAGYMEYTNAGSTNTFTVPALVNKLEATLISGGAGGGAGGQIVTNVDFTSQGEPTWTPPNITIGKYVKLTGCGSGGGGAGQRSRLAIKVGGGGGSGAYGSMVLKIENNTPFEFHIGGGGGGGAPYGPVNGENGGKHSGGGGGGGNNGQGLGLGGVPGSGTGKGGAGVGTTNTEDTRRNGGNAAGGGGGAGGAGTTATGNLRFATAASGGNGGTYYGGGGGGGEEGTGAGGGGGGATVFFIGGVQKALWAGGGGGAGPAACNIDDGVTAAPCYLGGAGGGGGGKGGGNGGDATDTYWKLKSKPGKPGLGGSSSPFTTHADGVGGVGGVIESSVFGKNNCSGGDSKNESTDNIAGQNGKPGAIRISYLSYGPGGSGGSGAAIVPIKNISVTPKEELKLLVGKAGIGHKAGKINESGVEIPATTETSAGWTTTNIGEPSTLQRGENIILRTSNRGSYCASPGCASGIVGNDTSTKYFCCACSGLIGDGELNKVTVKGFSSTSGHNAGDADGTKTIISGGDSSRNPYSNGSTGGAGGDATTPFTGTCTPGKGGTASNPEGGNAQGYGCGGGGGYGLSNGGSGSGGYARISWNKYWDVALNSGKGGYKYADAGTAGGGASGNIVTYTIDVKSGERIKFRIGKGGDGASVNNNTITNAKKGGDTLFAIGTNRTVKAGGGNGGGSPTITGTHPDTTISNGIGGSVNAIYTYKGQTIKTRCNSSSIISNCYIPSIQGNPGTSNKGGSGATLERNDKILRTNVNNSGGGGGTTGDNAKGANAVGYGSGGGGAGILDIGVPTISTHNPNTGGNGTNGKIILEWWE